MNHYGILTNYEEHMEANLEQYSRPEKAGAFHLRLDYRTWASECACSVTSPMRTPARRFALPAGATPKSTTHPYTTIDFARVLTKGLLRCAIVKCRD